MSNIHSYITLLIKFIIVIRQTTNITSKQYSYNTGGTIYVYIISPSDNVNITKLCSLQSEYLLLHTI